MHKSILWLCLCFGLVIPAAQAAVSTGYNTQTTAIGFFDNTPNFTAHNVWHLMPGTPQLVQFDSTLKSDGSFLFRGLDPARNVWSFTESQDSQGYHSSWSQVPAMGTDNSQLALGYGLIYKLNNSGCHTANSYAIKKWNGSAWVDPVSTESCSVQISVGDQDGALGSRTYSAHLYMLDPGTTAWVQLTGPSTTYQSIAVAGKNNVYANDYNGTIWQRQPGTNTLIPSPFPTTPEGRGVLVTDGGSQLWFKGSGATGSTYILRNNVWVHPIGQGATNLSTSAPMYTFAVVGNSLYRFAELGLAWTVQVSGAYVNCPPAGCPAGSAHTPTVDVEFLTGSLGHAHAVGTTVSATANVFASATARTYDPFSCILAGFDFSYCLNTQQTGGAVSCAVMGPIYGMTFANGGGGTISPVGLTPVPHPEICYATFKKTQKVTGSCHTSLGFILCDYYGVPYCTAATSPPDDQPLGSIPPYLFHDMLQSSADANGAFFHVGACVRVVALNGIPLTNWYNPLSALPGAVSTADTGPGNCKGPNDRPFP